MNEAELVLTELLGCPRHRLYLEAKLRLSNSHCQQLAAILKRRIQGEPLQYIIGKQDFFGLNFKVEKGVFIPRPETEILVEVVFRYAQAMSRLNTQARLLDIGTGSGCIAVALAYLLPYLDITALDVSQKAIQIARDNADSYGVRIKFVLVDIFRYNPKDLFDIVVSNPPYIPSRQIKDLQPEIQQEPSLALDGGEDGLRFYRRIFSVSDKLLKPGGVLALEMGLGQLSAIKEILQGYSGYSLKEVVRDYSNIERVIMVEKTA